MFLKFQSNKIFNPFFIISLLVLVLNDLWLKQYFSNTITGKLSDFAGLFVFPFFWSYFFPRFTKEIHILTAIFFLWFKSAWFSPILGWLHSFGIPVYRVIDYTDYMALLSIPLSYFIFSRSEYLYSNRYLKCGIVCLSIFSFIATTQRPSYRVAYNITDREYIFKATLSETVASLNEVEQERVDKMNERRKEYKYESIVLDKERGVFYESPNGITKYGAWFDVSNITLNNTIRYSSHFARFYIVADPNNEKFSKLVLEELYDSLEGYPPDDTLDVVLKEYPSTVLKAFEKMYIRPMKKKLDKNSWFSFL
ncbi:hypothetical protein LNQ81_02575 [Myroides sp. M-43]|uniref:hypothetical protein n=1 Tax=Myroides oncorhynchi TaxID=2893756 RepID=UPI001E495930|nr:hypothetical protein [Myroides oncorhynchi]MCC9041586.1 hypothetical protein [Myroides oncorhynchi]